MIYTEEQIRELVRLKYPKLETERSCLMEKTFRDLARKEYYNKLFNESEREKELLVTSGEDSTKD